MIPHAAPARLAPHFGRDHLVITVAITALLLRGY